MQPDRNQNGKLAPWDHVVPFVAWLALMVLLGEPTAWKYAVRTAACAGLFFYYKPWWSYEPLRRGHLWLALGAGLLVLAIWVIPESGWVPAGFREAYLRWAVMPFGKLPTVPETSPYDPAVCGWGLTAIRLLGSAVVIAVIEEFFWRGFLYRWLQGGDFLEVELGAWHAGYFMVVALVFGFEHDRWLAGTAAGLVYGLVMLRTRNLWAAGLAHVVTNLTLGLYVLGTGAYAFW